MRYIYTLLVILFFGMIAIFAFQNMRLVTVTFLHMQMTVPLALLIASVYFLGLLTGGALIAMIRNWIRHARK